MAGDLTFKSTLEVDEAISQLVKLKNAGIQVTDELATELNRKLGGKEIEKVVAIRTRFDDKGQLQYLKVTKDIRDQYDKLTRSLDRAEATQRGSVTSLRQQVNQAKQARDATAKYAESLDGIRSKANGITPAWAAQNEKVRQLQSELAKVDGSPFWDRIKGDLGVGGLISFINGLNQLVQGFQAVSIIVGQITGSVNKLTRALADLQAFRLTFQAIGLGASGAEVAFAESERIAKNLGVSIKTVREGFQQLTPVITNSGGSLQDVSSIVEALSSRFAAFGIAGDRSRRILNGVIQAFAKGKLQAEELTQQISEADSAFKTDFAAALGVTVAELEKLVQAGKVTTDVLIDTLPKLSKASLVYGTLGQSALDAATQLQKGATAIDLVQAKIETINQLSLEAFAKTIEPALTAFIKINAVVADFFATVSSAGALNTLANLFNATTSAIADLGRVFAAVAQGLLVALEPLAALVNALLKIPGVSQLIGVAIVGKIIAPLAALKTSLAETLASTKIFGAGFLKSVSTLEGARAAVSSFVNPAKQAAAEVGRLSGEQSKLGNVSQRVQGRIGSLKQELAATRKELLNIVAAGPGAQDALSKRLGAADSSQKIAALKSNISSLTEKIGKYEGVLGQVTVATSRNAEALKSASAVVSAKSGAFARIGTAAAGAGKLVASGFGAAAAAGKTLLAALGPIGIALIALATLQNAYNSAIEGSVTAIKKGEVALKAYDDLITSISQTEPEPPKLGPLEAAWQEFGLGVADAVDVIKGVLDGLVGFFQGIGSKISQALDNLPKPLSDIIQFLSPFTAALNSLGNSSDATGLKLRQFGREAKTSFGQIDQQIQKIKELTEALRRLSGEAGGDTEKKSNLLAQFKEGKQLVETTRQEVDRLQKKVEEFEQAREKGTLSNKDVKVLEETREQLDKAKGALGEARAAFRQLGKEIGAIDDSELQALVGTLTILSERAKDLQERLAEAPKGSKEFGVFAALLQAVVDETEELRKASQDPIVLKAGVEDALTEKVAELNKEYEKLRKEQAKPPGEVIDENVDQSRAKIAELRAEVERLNKLKVRLELESGDTFNNFNRNIQELEAKVLKFRFDSSEFREAIAELQTERNKLERLTARRLLIEVGLLESRGTDSLGNLQQQISKLEQAKVSIPFGAPELDDVNRKLREAKDSLDSIDSQKRIEFSINNTEFLLGLRGIRQQLALAELQLKTTIDQPSLRSVAAQISQFTQSIADQFKNIAAIRLRLTDDSLSSAERTKLLQEQALSAQAINVAVTKTTADLRDTALSLSRELSNARSSLLALATEGRSKGLSTGSAATAAGARSIALQQQALRSLDAQLQKIARDRGLQLSFRGTTEEVVKAKIEALEFFQRLEEGERKAQDLSSGIKEVDTFLEAINRSGLKEILEGSADFAEKLASSVENAGSQTGTLANGMASAATEAERIASALLSLDNRTITVNVRQLPTGLWTGGPAEAGQTYQVNELGQEGFLSNSGLLAPINKPKNALWRAPSSGTVIPAHMWSKMDVPKAGVKVDSAAIPKVSSGNPLRSIAQQIQLALSRDDSNAEMAMVQAQQALEIGKLSRAVDRLASKKMDVQVGITSTGNGAYLNALNSRL